ncbi:hypothetical protein [Pararhizobium sp. LjRoot238]|uniref:hypothetical protein n=1 Tax=Pararhizobium sp. LjRoot238 TaxID=3342293 RepID=UPI003ECFB219
MTGLADDTVHFNDPAKLQAAIAKRDEMETPVTRNGATVSVVDPLGHRAEARGTG